MAKNKPDLIFTTEAIAAGHGTAQGIIPRFYLQFIDLAEHSSAEIKNKIADINGPYFKKVLLSITKYYDLFHQIQDMISDFKNGVESGKYYTRDEHGSSNFNRGPEIEIENLVKTFFINGKILLVNFIKCGLVKDIGFDIENFYFSDAKKFNRLWEAYNKTANPKYNCIQNLLANANNGFLGSFNKIRGSIEHDGFSVERFTLINIRTGQYLTEPMLNNKYLSVTLEEFYEDILTFIEKTIVYYLSKNINYHGIFRLVVNPNPDFPNMRYRYLLHIPLPYAVTTVPFEYD